MTLGSDLMNQISRGELAPKSPDYALEVKHEVTEAMVEIITYGARIRPLLIDGKRAGWVRGFHASEKRQMDIWFPSDEEKVHHLAKLCTSLTEDEIDNLDLVEFNSLLKAIYECNLADLSLFPYVSAFATTQASVSLWSARFGGHLNPMRILMPDRKVIKSNVLSDHVKLWAAISTVRDATITKLENSLNSAVILQGFVGKEASPYVDQIYKALNMYTPDGIEPWLSTINFVTYTNRKDFSDGFGHSHEDSSTEGILRELKGMVDGDKHEVLMEKFYTQQIEQEKEKAEKVQSLIQSKREALEREDILANSMIVRTEREVQEREKQIKEQTYGWVNRENRLSLEDQNDEEELAESEKLIRLVKKYRS